MLYSFGGAVLCGVARIPGNQGFRFGGDAEESGRHRLDAGKHALSRCSGVSLFNVECFLRTEMGVMMRICVGRFPYPLVEINCRAAVGPCFSL